MGLVRVIKLVREPPVVGSITPLPTLSVTMVSAVEREKRATRRARAKVKRDMAEERERELGWDRLWRGSSSIEVAVGRER